MSKPSRRQLATIVVDRLDKGATSKDLARTLAGYLLDEHRTSELPAIMREAEALRASRGGPLEATVTTARAVPEDFKTDVQSVVNKMRGTRDQKVLIDHVTDSDVLGGVRVQSGEALLDATVRQQLNHLKHLNASAA